MPIFTIDDQPLSLGLLTHDIIMQIKICDHTEITTLGICSMSYLVLTGLGNTTLLLTGPGDNYHCHAVVLPLLFQLLVKATVL